MKCNYLIFGLLFLVLISCKNQKNLSASTQPLTGLWLLDKYETYDAFKGEWMVETARIGCVGYVLFDGLGHLALQIMPANNDFIMNKDSTGVKGGLDYYENSLIYFADYTLDGKELEQKIVSSTNTEVIGTILKRNFEVKEKVLLITPNQIPNRPLIRMRWIKMN